MLREIDTFKTDSKVHLNNIHDLLLQLKIKHFAHLRFLCSTGYKYSNIGQKKNNLFVSLLQNSTNINVMLGKKAMAQSGKK